MTLWEAISACNLVTSKIRFKEITVVYDLIFRRVGSPSRAKKSAKIYGGSLSHSVGSTGVGKAGGF